VIAWIIRKIRERRERAQRRREDLDWRRLCVRAAQHREEEARYGEDFHAERGDV